MSTSDWVWAVVGTVAIGSIAMQVPAWISRVKPMSPGGKVLFRNAAWLLCSALLGGLVGGAVATRGPMQVSTPSHRDESDVDSSDIAKLESEISNLRSRIRDLEDKVR